MRGRPPFEVTERIRNKVKLLLALGWSAQRVANAIDVSLATVKRYFRAELAQRDAMRDRLDARRLEIAAEKAMTGNPSAMRIFTQMIERSDLMERTRDLAGKGKTESEARQIVAEGKKAQKRTGAAAAIASDPDLFGTGSTRH
jgi:predicted transcriptional regulator